MRLTSSISNTNQNKKACIKTMLEKIFHKRILTLEVVLYPAIFQKVV